MTSSWDFADEGPGNIIVGYPSWDQTRETSTASKSLNHETIQLTGYEKVTKGILYSAHHIV